MPLSDSSETSADSACRPQGAAPGPHDDGETDPVCCGGTGEGHLGADGEACADGDAPASSCPKPLSWRGVLKAFRAEAETTFVERDGYRLQVRSWGSGEPLYFLNGFGGTAELFVLQAAVLRDEFRCVLFDESFPEQPGGRPGRAVTPESAVADLLAVADACGDEAFSLFGANLGGALALAAMRAQSQRIVRAVLQGAFAHRRFSVIERALIALGRSLPGKVRHVPLRTTLQVQNHRPWFPPFDGSRWSFLTDDTGRVPLRVIAQRVALAAQLDLRNDLPQITTPILIVQTEGEGQIAAQCQAELKAGLPQVQTVWLDNTGQLPFLTHPHRLGKLLRTFLQGEPLPEACHTMPESIRLVAEPAAVSRENYDD